MVVVVVLVVVIAVVRGMDFGGLLMEVVIEISRR